MQGLLYGCMLAMPIVGLIGAPYTNRGVALFGIKLPAWTVPSHDAAEQFFTVHSTLAFILTALIVLHVLAGFKHLLMDKDRVFLSYLVLKSGRSQPWRVRTGRCALPSGETRQFRAL